MRYRISEEFRGQFPWTGTNPPAKIPLKNGGGTVHAYADAFNNDIALDAFVKVSVDGRTYSMTVGAASDLIDQLAEAVDMAEGEQELFEEYVAEQAKKKAGGDLRSFHPRAVEVDGPGGYVIWCDDEGQFWYSWIGSVSRTRFTPGVDFQANPAFAATRDNIALWSKLAFEAGRDVAANSAKYPW
jgi:hypothetical protein